MPTIRIGVQAAPGSVGQIVDDGVASANITSLQNLSTTDSIAYSVDSGATWNTVAASGTASPGPVTGNMFRVRRGTAGGYPIPVDMTFTEITSQVFYDPTASTIRLRDGTAVASGGGGSTVAPQIYGAPNWDAGYRAALATAKTGSGLCRITAITDSLGYGYYASNLDTTSVYGIVKTGLQSLYGDGGSGIVSVNRSTVVLTADARAAAIQNAWQTAGNLISLTGTWTEVTNGTDGPGGGVLIGSTTGATATFVVRGSTVEIFYQSVPSLTAAGSFTYQIDGGAVSGPIQSYRVTQGAVEKVTVTGLSAGTHTVVITATDANGTLNFSLCGVSGRNATGVVFDQCSRGGQTSDIMNTTNAAAWTSAGGKSWGGSAQNLRGGVVGWNGGASRPCDLAILAFGLNDATTDKTPSTFFNNHRMALESIRAGNPDASVLFVRNHRGAATIDGTQFYYSQYERELQALARTWNCGIINFWAAGKNSYSYMNGLGYWGTANTAVGVSGSDVVHLSDAGSSWQGNALLNLLK